MLRNILTLFTVCTFLIFPTAACGADLETAKSLEILNEVIVTAIIDGDTIEIGGVRVRYLGIDAPELEEPLYSAAKERNRELLEGKRINLEVCKGEPRDRYGRLLAWVYADGELINLIILREGYARLLIIAPCGLEKAKTLGTGLQEAIGQKVGLWSGIRDIPFQDARHHTGTYARVTGRVADVYDSGKALFLNFSQKRDEGFYAVIFHNDLEVFRAAGIEPSGYLGRVVTITGRIVEYRGRPEIVVESPYQIEINNKR
ncbi:MAG: thermonuclease family protein [Thermodesulfobacteriota bacterium]